MSKSLDTVSLAQRLETASLPLSNVNKISLPAALKLINAHLLRVFWA